jgi:hypothetical protein
MNSVHTFATCFFKIPAILTSHLFLRLSGGLFSANKNFNADRELEVAISELQLVLLRFRGPLFDILKEYIESFVLFLSWYVHVVPRLEVARCRDGK